MNAADTARPPQAIVIAVDLTRQSDEVCRVGAELARCIGAHVVLVHVVHELAALLGISTQQHPVTDLQADIEQRGGEALQRLVDEHFTPAAIPTRRRLAVGTPWAELLDIAREENAAMLVIGTHCSDKPEHGMLGGTAQRVVQHVDVPVLLVPRRDA